jgi:hypothetical protein
MRVADQAADKRVIESQLIDLTQMPLRQLLVRNDLLMKTAMQHVVEQLAQILVCERSRAMIP